MVEGFNIRQAKLELDVHEQEPAHQLPPFHDEQECLEEARKICSLMGDG